MCVWGGGGGRGCPRFAPAFSPRPQLSILKPFPPAKHTHTPTHAHADIAYFKQMGADGSTTPGTWITYNDERSAVAITEYAKSLGLGGVFTFDSSMDTMDSNGDFTYGISMAVAAALGA